MHSQNEWLVRSITGLVLISSLCVPLLYEPKIFSVLVIVILVLGILEFVSMAKNQQPYLTALSGVVFLSGCVFCSYFLEDNYICGLLLFLPLLLLLLYHRKSRKSVYGLFYLFFMWIFPGFLLFYISWNYDSLNLKILYFFIAVWTNDTLAFIGGKLYGHKKLAPGISPGKTIEGTLTGLLFASLLMMILQPLPFSDLYNLGFGLVAGIGSVFGDLAESWLKRLNVVKDSGKLLPGHGGFLDRFDAAFGAVIPVLLYILIIKGTL